MLSGGDAAAAPYREAIKRGGEEEGGAAEDGWNRDGNGHLDRSPGTSSTSAMAASGAGTNGSATRFGRGTSADTWRRRVPQIDYTPGPTLYCHK
jgi:hypothetical protein